MGKRFSSNHLCELRYYECEFVDGEASVSDTNELEEVKWVSGQEALALIESEIYKPIEEILKSS